MIEMTYEQAVGMCVGAGLITAGAICVAVAVIHFVERRRKAARRAQSPLTLLKGRPVVDAVDVANEAHAELSQGRHRWGRR